MCEKKETVSTADNSEDKKMKKKRLSVSFKQEFVETIEVDGWKQFNQDCSKSPYEVWGGEKPDLGFKPIEKKKKSNSNNVCGNFCIIC